MVKIQQQFVRAHVLLGMPMMAYAKLYVQMDSMDKIMYVLKTVLLELHLITIIFVSVIVNMIVLKKMEIVKNNVLLVLMQIQILISVSPPVQ